MKIGKIILSFDGPSLSMRITHWSSIDTPTQNKISNVIGDKNDVVNKIMGLPLNVLVELESEYENW